MAGSKYLLDTNIISAWLSGEKSIADKIDEAATVYIPLVVIGELYYGAFYSDQKQKNIHDIEKLTNRYKVLLADRQTAKEYGKIKAALRRKGRPIPENDVWIAALAAQYKLKLVTRDGHFAEVTNIKTVQW
jgi:tRNA(fMet)-specific endonuclease VapC